MSRRLAPIAIVLACVLHAGAAVASPTTLLAPPPGAPVASTAPLQKNRLRDSAISVGSGTVALIGASADHAADKLVRSGERMQLHPAKPVKAIGRSLVHTGNVLKLLAGSETLKHTSFELDASIGTAVPGFDYAGDAYASVGFWTGSAAYWSDVQNGREQEAHFNAGVGVSTLVAGIGYDTTYGRSTSYNAIPGFSASTYARGYSVDVQIPNLALVGLGEVRGTREGAYARGPYMTVGLSVPLAPLFGAPIYLSGGATLYYPPLAGVTRHLRKHVAKLERLSNKIERAVVHATKAVGSKLGLKPREATPS